MSRVCRAVVPTVPAHLRYPFMPFAPQISGFDHRTRGRRLLSADVLGGWCVEGWDHVASLAICHCVRPCCAASVSPHHARACTRYQLYHTHTHTHAHARMHKHTHTTHTHTHAVDGLRICLAAAAVGAAKLAIGYCQEYLKSRGGPLGGSVLDNPRLQVGCR